MQTCRMVNVVQCKNTCMHAPAVISAGQAPQVCAEFGDEHVKRGYLEFALTKYGCSDGCAAELNLSFESNDMMHT